MLALGHFVWVLLPLFRSVHLYLLVYACVCVLICVIKHSSYLWFHMGSHPPLNTRSWVPFRNFAWWHTSICTPILWLYGHQIQTYICPSRTPSLVCLFDNMFVCSFVFFLSLSTCLVCFPSALFVSLLSLLHVCCLCVFFVCCMYMLEHNFQNASQKSKNASKMNKPKKGID